LADREPYSSYADRNRPSVPEKSGRAQVILGGPPRLDDPCPDFVVLPAEYFLSLPRASLAYSGIQSGFIAYGPVELMEAAFDRGCADYLREPWGLLELRVRVCRLAKGRFSVGGRFFELRATRLVGNSGAIELSECERGLLSLLLRNAPLPVPRDIASNAVSDSACAKGYALSHCIISLRRKMEIVETGLGSKLHTIRGFGYRMEVEACG